MWIFQLLSRNGKITSLQWHMMLMSKQSKFICKTTVLAFTLSGTVVLLLTELTSAADDKSIGIEYCQKISEKVLPVPTSILYKKSIASTCISTWKVSPILLVAVYHDINNPDRDRFHHTFWPCVKLQSATLPLINMWVRIDCCDIRADCGSRCKESGKSEAVCRETWHSFRLWIIWKCCSGPRCWLVHFNGCLLNTRQVGWWCDVL